GRINAIDADEYITLVNVQNVDEEMFDVDALDGEEVIVAWKNENVVEEVVDATQVSTASTNVTITTEEITLAQALDALKTSKPKGKGIMIEEPVKPMKKKVQIMLDEEVALKLQAEFDKEERLAREKAEKEKEANIALIEEWDDIQAKIDVDHQLAERLQAQEQAKFSDTEKATLFQQLLEKGRKYFAAKRAEEKRNNPPTQAQQRKIMRVNTFVDFITDLVEGSLKRAGEELEQESTKKQKVDENKDTAELQSLMKVIPDEEEVAINDVPLATKPPTIVIEQVAARSGMDSKMVELLSFKLDVLDFGTCLYWYQRHGYREQGQNLNYNHISSFQPSKSSVPLHSGTRRTSILSPISSLDPITPPTILTPSPVLPPSLLFDPRYFFVPEELLPPKKRICSSSSSSTTLSNSSRNQTCNLSSLVYTPTPPQVFEIEKCSDKMYLKHHEKQVEDILNYLDELYLHRIERMEEGRINGNELKTELKKIRTQIIKLQKKQLGQKDKIAFPYYRNSDLEQIIEKIQARHQTDQEDL
ncbi:hypothetical protein Tco_0359914, partial [Tanacetum coccineum]